MTKELWTLGTHELGMSTTAIMKEQEMLELGTAGDTRDRNNHRGRDKGTRNTGDRAGHY